LVSFYVIYQSLVDLPELMVKKMDSSLMTQARFHFCHHH